MSRSNLSARFITGRSKIELQRLLLAYQTKYHRQVNIISVYPEKDGSVTAWFYDDPENYLTEEIAKSNVGNS